MTTLIESDPRVLDRIRRALPGAVVVLPTTDGLEAHLEREPSEHAVVLGPSVSVEAAAEVAERNRIVRPALGVVLVRHTVDNAVLARALRSGMREVVATDDATALAHAVRRAQAVARAMFQTGEQGEVGGAAGALVTVFSTKGGVGKSLVATSLGTALAGLGHRTCIVDLDIEGGDVAIMLSLNPQHTLADLARINGAPDTGAVESLLTQHSERLSVLAAPLHLGTTVSAPAVGGVLDVLKGMFDVVIVDTAGAFDDHALQALDHSDLLVLVGTLDIPSLKGLKLAVGTLDLLNYPRDLWRLLLNRADARIGLSKEEVEKTLGLSVTTTVPSSRDVLMAVNRGESIVRAEPNHEVSRALGTLAASIARDIALPARPGQSAGQPAEQSAEPRRRAPRRGLRAKKVA